MLYKLQREVLMRALEQNNKLRLIGVKGVADHLTQKFSGVVSIFEQHKIVDQILSDTSYFSSLHASFVLRSGKLDRKLQVALAQEILFLNDMMFAREGANLAEECIADLDDGINGAIDNITPLEAAVLMSSGEATKRYYPQLISKITNHPYRGVRSDFHLIADISSNAKLALGVTDIPDDLQKELISCLIFDDVIGVADTISRANRGHLVQHAMLELFREYGNGYSEEYHNSAIFNLINNYVKLLNETGITCSEVKNACQQLDMMEFWSLIESNSQVRPSQACIIM